MDKHQKFEKIFINSFEMDTCNEVKIKGIPYLISFSGNSLSLNNLVTS